MSRSISLLCAAVGAMLLLSSLVGCTPRGKSQSAANSTANPPANSTAGLISPNTSLPIYDLALTDGVTLDLNTVVQPATLLSETKVETVLAEEATFTFIDAPLSEVCEQLTYLFRIDFELDYGALEDVGIGPAMPIRATVSEVPLSSALDRIVEGTGMGWTVADEAVLLTSEEQVESRLVTKLYEVTDLVVCRDDADKLWDDFDSLTDVVTATVSPTSWDVVGGPATVMSSWAGSARVLVVSQSYRSHREIARLLTVLREIAKGRQIDRKPPLRNPL
ncbi:MAG: hypothetical protein HQ567_26875 [Candidatus Nealsonbacteria bacterium]|nr:hypothetical protein [Candidatus Nealsonbacteria bacterium]